MHLQLWVWIQMELEYELPQAESHSMMELSNSTVPATGRQTPHRQTVQLILPLDTT